MSNVVVRTGEPCERSPNPSTLDALFRLAGRYLDIGTNSAPRIVNSNAESPIAVLIGDTVRKPSDSVMPLILQITQKPLSVIHETGLLPAPIAIAKYTGWNGNASLIANPCNTLAEVIIAIVADPCTVRIAAVIANASGNSITPGTSRAMSATASAMPA